MTTQIIHRKLKTAVALSSLILLLSPAFLPGARGETEKPALSTQEQLRLGERMYREGILPSGKPMQAFVQGDVPVSGSSFTCVSCHLRSGMGSIEGTIITPPTNGRILYQPRNLFKKGFEMVPSVRRYSLGLPERPAYTDATLSDCMIGGVDPAGRTLSRTMPVYHLEKNDMATLIAYLKTLSAELPPGVSDKEIHFATIITDDARPEDVQAMLVPIEDYLKRKNGLAAAFKRRPQSTRMALNMMGPDLVAKKMTMSHWLLKGSPDTWRAQLEEYYRKDPVFAFLGGISGSGWQPMQQFCEDHQIPDLFPVTDYPEISTTDWYTFYISKGIYQEGEGAARYLNSFSDLFKGKNVVQIVRSSRKGKALSEGFVKTWSNFGHPAIVTVTLSDAEPLTGEFLTKLLAKEKPAALVIWDDAKALPALSAIASNADRPGIVMMSSAYLGNALWDIPETVRDYLYVTYPYRLPQEDARMDSIIAPYLKDKKFDEAALRIIKQSYALVQLQSQAFMDMRGEYYRDFLFDSIGMMPDMEYPLYERLSFGPGQRYASKGCYIVQLGKGPTPELIKKSDWAIH